MPVDQYGGKEIETNQYGEADPDGNKIPKPTIEKEEEEWEEKVEEELTKQEKAKGEPLTAPQKQK